MVVGFSSKGEEIISAKPLVSIVTPSLNQAGFLEKAIQSVLSQDYPNLEYIIVDGGSTDSSAEIIRRYSDRLAWWVSEADKGHADALNKGFSKTKGEILAWLNSDDTYVSGAISEAVAFLESHPEVGLVYGDANLIDEDDNFIGKFPSRQTDYQRLMRGYVHIPQATTFFRARFFHELGALDTSLYFAFDYEFWVRISKVASLCYLPRLWANFRLHEAGKSVVADDRCWPEMVEVHRREGGKRISVIATKAAIRQFCYGRMPIRWRLWVRRFI